LNKPSTGLQAGYRHCASLPTDHGKTVASRNPESLEICKYDKIAIQDSKLIYVFGLVLEMCTEKSSYGAHTPAKAYPDVRSVVLREVADRQTPDKT